MAYLAIGGCLLAEVTPLEPVLPKKALRVGLWVDEPYVIETPEGPGGFCIELWNEISQLNGWESTYEIVPTVEEMFTQIQQGKLDVGLGPFRITSERMRSVDFTHPFHESGLQIMVNTNRHHAFLKLWEGLVEGGHLKIFALGGGLIFVFTHLLMLYEWKSNPEFTKKYFPAFADCLYHVMSICMHGKATHRGLPGPWGKILAALWLAGGLAVVAYVTSTITSVMTANKLRNMIHGPGDLVGQPVATIRGSSTEKACQKYGFVIFPFPDLKSATGALVNHSVMAVVFDTYALRYFDHRHPELPLEEVGPVFERGEVGFALPLGSELRRPINRTMVKLKEDGSFHLLDAKYFEATAN
ncbi:MAG: transporter substrate-binding domain-containing protein [Verrucomicrobia bacterium]|nr:transporter substrate-binding domain-containing protein [Verrucomicrobiota bacterium]